MNKNTFFVSLIVGLLISNILMFFYMGYLKNNLRFDPDKPRNTVIEKLDLSPEQIKIYDRLIFEHRKQIKARNQKVIQLKNELYSRYLLKENEAAKDSLILELSLTQKEIEHIHFNHFKDIKNICREDQMSKCEELFKEITSIFPQKTMLKK